MFRLWRGKCLDGKCWRLSYPVTDCSAPGFCNPDLRPVSWDWKTTCWSLQHRWQQSVAYSFQDQKTISFARRITHCLPLSPLSVAPFPPSLSLTLSLSLSSQARYSYMCWRKKMHHGGKCWSSRRKLRASCRMKARQGESTINSKDSAYCLWWWLWW